jgi:Transglutaminase-like superfamily
MKRYAAPPLSSPHVHLGFIPKGYLGTQRTLQHIKALIRAGAKDFYVRQKAIDILITKAVRPKDYLGEIKALFEWVQHYVRYTKDPFQIEVLHSARRLLELRAGDCDDMTILLGAMLEAIGHPVRLVIIGPDPSQPKLFSHIYLEAFHQGRWIPLDATMPYPMGWEPRTFVKQIVPIERNPQMMAPTPVAPNSITATVATTAELAPRPLSSQRLRLMPVQPVQPL